MAEIDIERKPHRSGWGWMLTFLLLLVVAGAAWYFTSGPGGGWPGADTDSVTVVPGPRVTPPEGVQTPGTPAPGTTTPAPGAP
jgi:hypothetical protein